VRIRTGFSNDLLGGTEARTEVK